MRVFLGTGTPVEFVPRNPEDVTNTQQMTQYINYKPNQQNYLNY